MNRFALKLAIVVLNFSVSAAFAETELPTSGGDVSTSAQSSQAVQNAGPLQEIVVTAQRREERLSDVPMTLTALEQAGLDERGVRQIDDLTREVPGITFLRNGVSVTNSNYNDENSDISIRGIDSTAGAATTAIYVDDTPIQTRHLAFSSVIPYPALFDLERVEVLKGPQGTLFGAGAEGGAVRFITPEASLSVYTGYARAEIGQIAGGGQNYEAGAAVGGPIIDGVLGFRISASFREDGGWVDRVDYSRPSSVAVPCAVCFTNPATLYTALPVVTNTTERNANWHDTDTFRAAMKWEPVTGLVIDPSIYVQTLHINDTGAYWLNISDPSSNRYYNGNAQRDPSTDPWYLGAIKVTWALPSATLVSNTSYLSRSQHALADYTQWIDTVFFANQYPPAGDTSTSAFTDRQHNFAEEIRISSSDKEARFQWSAGVFYTHAAEDSSQFIYSKAAAPNAPGYVATSSPNFNMLDKQLALFGEASFKILNELSFTAGARASRLEYTSLIQLFQTGSFCCLNINSSASASENPVTPRFVLSYKPDSDSLYYLSAAKGFRPGGVNLSAPAFCNINIPLQFSSDSLWQYEIGSKKALFDQRLQVDASLYYVRWKNIQQLAYLACGIGFDYNLGEVVSKGVDLAVNWRVTDNLTMGFTGAYTDAKYTDSVIVDKYPLVASGDHLPASPWNLDLNAEYVWNSVPKSPYLRLDYQYATAQRSLTPYQDPANVPNDDPTIPGIPEIRILSIRAGVRFSGLDISMFAQNALDYHSAIFVSRDLATTALNGYPADLSTNYFGRGYAPRTIGVTATYRF